MSTCPLFHIKLHQLSTVLFTELWNLLSNLVNFKDVAGIVNAFFYENESIFTGQGHGESSWFLTLLVHCNTINKSMHAERWFNIRGRKSCFRCEWMLPFKYLRLFVFLSNSQSSWQDFIDWCSQTSCPNYHKHNWWCMCSQSKCFDKVNFIGNILALLVKQFHVVYMPTPLNSNRQYPNLKMDMTGWLGGWDIFI